MAIILSLISASAFGISDFLGGLFARKSTAWQIAVVGQSSSAVAYFLAALVLGGTAGQADWLWAIGGGVGSGTGAVFLYRGLAHGRMGVVAPVSAVSAALLPLAVGLSLGERPSALSFYGVLLALPAIWLISTVVDENASRSGGVGDGVIAGLGFGVQFVCFAQISPDAKLTPIWACQVAAVTTIIMIATIRRQTWLPRDRFAFRAAVMGPIGALAGGAYLFATHYGLLSIVAVLTSLYPAATVFLAALWLKEKIHAWQALGIALAIAAISLVALG